jgi:hypothetical protein
MRSPSELNAASVLNRTLHKDSIHPSPELETYCLKHSDLAESKSGAQSYRCVIVCIAMTAIICLGPPC